MIFDIIKSDMEVETIVVPTSQRVSGAGCMGGIGVFLFVVFLIWLCFWVFPGSSWVGWPTNTACYTPENSRNYGNSLSSYDGRVSHQFQNSNPNNSVTKTKPRTRLSALTNEDDDKEEDIQTSLHEMHRATGPRGIYGTVLNSKVPAWNL